MTLSQSAVSDLLDAFRAGDGVNLIRDAVQMVLQEMGTAPALVDGWGWVSQAAVA